MLVDDGAEADGDGNQHDAIDKPIQQTSRVLCAAHLQSYCTGIDGHRPNIEKNGSSSKSVLRSTVD
jgi:hypothetical protein